MLIQKCTQLIMCLCLIVSLLLLTLNTLTLHTYINPIIPVGMSGGGSLVSIFNYQFWQVKSHKNMKQTSLKSKFYFTLWYFIILIMGYTFCHDFPSSTMKMENVVYWYNSNNNLDTKMKYCSLIQEK